MLRQNIMPNYFEFYEAGGHIKLMDLSKYETVKKDIVPDETQLKTASCVCICKCDCNKKVDSDSCSIPSYCPCDDETTILSEIFLTTLYSSSSKVSSMKKK